jgi:hypothetical protein
VDPFARRRPGWKGQFLAATAGLYGVFGYLLLAPPHQLRRGPAALSAWLKHRHEVR